MNWIKTDELIGMTSITAIDTVQRYPAGMIVHAIDADSNSMGGGEFIYLPGVNGTTPGSLVQYDNYNKTTALGAAANSGVNLAVAMSACVGGNWGWYQVYGACNINKDGTALTAGGVVGLGTALGTVGASTAGQQIQGAKALAAAAAGASQALVLINRSEVQSRIT